MFCLDQLAARLRFFLIDLLESWQFFKPFLLRPLLLLLQPISLLIQLLTLLPILLLIKIILDPNQILIFLHQPRILLILAHIQGINLREAAHILSNVGIPLFLSLPYFLFSFFRGDLDSLACQHASVTVLFALVYCPLFELFCDLHQD